MCTNFEDQSLQPLGRLIYHMAQDLGKFAEKILKPFDLTLEQLHILKTMPSTEGMTQKAIGAAVNKSPANMTRILDRLEGKNLVKRRQDPNDRRATLVFVTEKGKKIIIQVTTIFDSFSTHFLDGVTDQEQQIIREAFNKMSDNLQKMADKPCV